MGVGVLFQFRLDPLEDVPAWRGPDGLSVGWFGLTAGWFWMEVSGQELFRYSQGALEHWARASAAPVAELPYEGYFVARYWEDLVELLYGVLDPIPDDLAARLADAAGWDSWLERARHWQEGSGDNEDAWDTYFTATGWWSERTWDAGHLAYPPRLWLWRVAETLHLRWDNRGIVVDDIPVWEAQHGEARVPVPEFLAEVESFNERLLAGMGRRVESVHTAWPHPDIAIDLPALEREQQDRAEFLAPALHPWAWEVRRAFSWDQVRAAISAIDRQLHEATG